MEVKWDDALLRMHKSTSLVRDDRDRITFNGLRVRMGIHTGTVTTLFPLSSFLFLSFFFFYSFSLSPSFLSPFTFSWNDNLGVPDFCERDATSKRMDYFGPAMNLAGMHSSIPLILLG